MPENGDSDCAPTGSAPAQVTGKTYCIPRDANGTVVYNQKGERQAIRRV